MFGSVVQFKHTKPEKTKMNVTDSKAILQQYITERHWQHKAKHRVYFSWWWESNNNNNNVKRGTSWCKQVLILGDVGGESWNVCRFANIYLYIYMQVLCQGCCCWTLKTSWTLGPERERERERLEAWDKKTHSSKDGNCNGSNNKSRAGTRRWCSSSSKRSKSKWQQVDSLNGARRANSSKVVCVCVYMVLWRSRYWLRDHWRCASVVGVALSISLSLSLQSVAVHIHPD